MTRIVNNKSEEVPAAEDFLSKQRISWSWNNRTRQSFIENGLKEKIPHYLEDVQVAQFLAKVDHKNKYVPIRSVTRIIRERAPDWNTEHQESKEWLIYYENWYGKDWLGRDIAPVTDHVQGVYDEVVMQDVINDYGDIEDSKFKETRKVHYIPFSKKAVDDIIATSNNTDSKNIKFIFKGNQFRTGDWTYEQFVNSTWEEMEEIARTPSGPTMFDHYQKQIVKERQEKIRNKQYG